MYSKSKQLTSIPEHNESDLDLAATKWVPKKKHEVLKAKYKCLKKLFQIYDASVIGILPETYGQGDGFSVEEKDADAKKSRRKRRSHRTRTDACAGTADLASDVSETTEPEPATAVIRDLKIECSNTMTAQTATSKSNTTVESEFKQNVAPSKDCFSTSSVQCRCMHDSGVPFQHPAPYYYTSERRKPTRFQNFMQRLLGIRREPYKGFVLNGHVLAASDNEINQRYVEKRRRRGLRPCRRRCRRLRRPKRAQSDGALRGPLLGCAQAVQRNCLMDTTPRQCPIAGCRMMLYGIINYNDHLNLCHFTERRFVCHYCHEGFEQEADKLQHESEHIGLSHLAPAQRSATSDTQTDPAPTPVPEDKLKKIVSFFDKIDSDQILSEIKQNRCSESNLKSPTVVSDSGQSYGSTVKRMSSCVETTARSRPSLFGVKCGFCGEKFEFRRQLSLHMDVEHRAHDKFSKFHSCAGLVSPHASPGQLTITSSPSTTPSLASSLAPSSIQVRSQRSSDVSESESSKTSVNSIVGRLRGVNVRWEPGTKIIRV